jgi:hypothetical protein
MNRTDYGHLFLSTGGTIVAGAAVCLIAGTIGLGGFLAALAAAWIALVIVNSMDRADRLIRR